LKACNEIFYSRLKGDEETIGGFDLIYKNQDIGVGTASTYTTMLGCKNNREDNLKKLARTTAFRLAKEYVEKTKSNTNSANKKVENKFNIKPINRNEKQKVVRPPVSNEVKRKKV
jgi:hypothetical protein